MGFLFQKIQDAQTTRHERETINKVVRVLSKSMDLWISLYLDYGTPPTADECVTLEDTRISELMAEYRPKVAQDRKSTRLNSSHPSISRMPSSA